METSPKKVLITGSAGFVGVHLVNYLLEHTDYDLVCLDSLRHMGDSQRVTINDRCKFFTHDLGVPITKVLKDKIGHIDYIVNVASDSAVGRSITDPEQCWMNNTKLIFHILEYAREVKPSKFIHISTDEVYGECYGEPHKEWDTINPTNPYSASKLAQEGLCIAYFRTYKMPIVILNCQNMFGEYQNPEKMIPLTISKLTKGEEIDVHIRNGVPGSRRYTDAINLCDGIKFILQNVEPYVYQNLETPEQVDRFHIAGFETIDNVSLVAYIAELMGITEYKVKLVESSEIRPGYDKTYSLDDSKIRRLGWEPVYEFKESLVRTIDWFQKNKEWL